MNTGYFCTMANEILDKLLKDALKEDIGPGDYSSLAVIPPDRMGKTVLLAKEKGVLAGVRVALRLFQLFDPELKAKILIEDGSNIRPGDHVMYLEGKSLSLLQVERLTLNIIQRMSGIATLTAEYVSKTQGTRAKILDTRKTTPNMRILEKEAVRIGGGENHRMGLYDMIMLKDNHIDFAGGIKQAIEKSRKYISDQDLPIKIEIEVRNFEELNQVLANVGVDRIMLDNFTPEETKKAVNLIAGKIEIESSGGINLETIRDYALTGVDYISVGALTHQIYSLDLSLKAIL